MFKKAIFLALLLCAVKADAGRINPPVWFEVGSRKIERNEIQVMITAHIASGWRIYSTEKYSFGPIPTTIQFLPATGYQLIGPLKSVKPIIEYEDSYQKNLGYFTGTVTFTQRIRRSSNAGPIKVKIGYMALNDHICLSPENVTLSVPTGSENR
ncbi:protein-disulfide reductase DsbD domain-containing protein [Mucilaginibacter conchicola]|nr:protein-disulfide reductase DsbD domain-containing protein [Mucilaginibacter conchicola]